MTQNNNGHDLGSPKTTTVSDNSLSFPTDHLKPSTSVEDNLVQNHISKTNIDNVEPLNSYLSLGNDSNMTVRIKLQALTKSGMLYTYNDVPFTGEAYDHPDELLKKVYILNRGVIVAEKNHGVLVPEQPAPLQVNERLLNVDDYYDAENDDYPAYYQGKPFTGIGYFYVDGFCRTESQYLEGDDIEVISWLADGTGRISDYEKTDSEHYYRFTWEYGQLAKFYLSKDGAKNSLSCHMNEEQQITLMMLEGDYRQVYPQIPRSDLGLDFQTVDELLQRDQIAGKLEIYGISDNLFNDLLSAHYFSTVKHLILSETEIAPETVKKLVKLPQLTTLSIIDSKFTGEEFPVNQTEREAALNQALQWVHQQTGCKVELKRD